MYALNPAFNCEVGGRFVKNNLVDTVSKLKLVDGTEVASFIVLLSFKRHVYQQCSRATASVWRICLTGHHNATQIANFFLVFFGDNCLPLRSFISLERIFGNCRIERHDLRVRLVALLQFNLLDKIYSLVDLLATSRLLPNQLKRLEIMQVTLELRRADLVITYQTTTLRRY